MAPILSLGHRCQGVTSAILVPFFRPDEQAEQDRPRLMLKRRLPAREAGGEVVPLWTERRDRPAQVYALDPAFQDAMLPPGTGIDGNCWWLEMHPDACHPFRECDVGYRKETYRVQLKSVQVVLMAAHAGVAILEFDFGDNPTIDDVVTRVYGLRRLRTEGKGIGLTFAQDMAAPGPDFRQALGSKLEAASKACAAPAAPKHIDVGAFVNWLLLLPGEDPAQIDPRDHRLAVERGTPMPREGRVGLARHALHQTSVILEDAVDEPTAHAVLFHLRRGYTSAYKAPVPSESSDLVLRPRGNRWLGVSREGAAALSWLVPGDAGAEFEKNQWAPAFAGVYRCLLLHAVSERAQLAGLARMLSRFGRGLSVDAPAHPFRLSRGERGALDRVAARTISQILMLTGDDPGGDTEYRDFFRAARSAFNLPELLAEVRSELRDLTHMVEAVQARDEEASARRLQFLVAAGGLILAPYAIAQGMNAVRSDSPWRNFLVLWPAAVLIVALCLYLLRRRRR